MRSVRPLFVLVTCLPVLACVMSPASRTAWESSDPVTLKGYVGAPGKTVTLQVVDQNTGQLTTLGMPVSGNTGSPYTTPGGTSYTAYPWSYTTSVLPKKYWAPQSIAPNLGASQGHLEIFASVGAYDFITFSEAAITAAMASGKDPVTAGAQYTDGNSTVLFDQNGVGSGPETAWKNVLGMTSTPPCASSPCPYTPVAWSLGYYTVEGGMKIYGLICPPTTGGPYPVVIYNHGGISTIGGNIDGAITASGWSTPPAVLPDNLGQCLDWAKRGWIFATSSYRGQTVSITSANTAIPASTTLTSDGSPELCLGQVTDVLALTDLLVNHASSIAVGPTLPGSTTPQVTLNPNHQLFMYGYSHGGCITYRAVEQGAPVTAFSVIEGFTDFRLTYMNVWNANAPPAGVTLEDAAAAGAGAYTSWPPTTYYYPDAHGVMGYNWRSAHYFASRGDLSIEKFKTMPIMIFHGDVDAGNPVFLDEPAEIAGDIGATSIFVGPGGTVLPPPSQPCIAGPVGAPFPDPNNPPATVLCPIAFTPMDTGDSCLTPDSLGLLGQCAALPLPLTPPAGQAQQLHYLVVYHNMNHVNGGLAFKETFNGFVEQTFATKPGCNGVEFDCNTD